MKSFADKHKQVQEVLKYMKPVVQKQLKLILIGHGQAGKVFTLDVHELT